MEEPVKLVPTASDREVAADLKRRVEAVLQEIVSLMGEADRNGMAVQFQLGRNQFGQHCITGLSILKVL